MAIGLAFATIPLAATGCDLSEARSPDLRDLRPWWEIEGVAPPERVDSIFPAEVALEQFRSNFDEVTALAGGASSREALVDLFVRAVERGDTIAVAELAITPAEFAWLYFPHTMYMAPPYELPPGVVWHQQQNRSSRGFNRVLGRYAGEELYYTGLRCPDDGETFGDGRIWHGCTVLGELPEAGAVEEQLFGSIIELAGVYKLVSFSNEL
jgi:hypothetical protein